MAPLVTSSNIPDSRSHQASNSLPSLFYEEVTSKAGFSQENDVNWDKIELEVKRDMKKEEDRIRAEQEKEVGQRGWRDEEEGGGEAEEEEEMAEDSDDEDVKVKVKVKKEKEKR